MSSTKGSLPPSGLREDQDSNLGNIETLSHYQTNVNQMSYFVADFLINPVLRQARRFSGNTVDRVESVTNQGTTHHEIIPHHEESISEMAESMGANLAIVGDGSFSDRPLVASPIDEDGGLQDELAAFDTTDATRGGTEPTSAVPRRLGSYRSDRMSIDNEVSDNPSFGVPNRFQTGSPMSTSFSSISRHRRNSPTDASRRSTEDDSPQVAIGNNTRQRNGSLPEDDGMTDLRRRILSIQKRDISAAEKAKLMHQLLTEGYSHSQISLHGKQQPRAQSPASMVSQDRPTTPVSLKSFGFWQTPANGATPETSPSSSGHTIHLSPEDRKPTYTTVGSGEVANSDDSDDVEVAPSLGCAHYKRNVKLQCSSCGGWYTCRFCHDEVEDHMLNRKETRNMLCMLCGSAQRASDVCSNCNVRAAWYYCGICKLWDDDANKSIYHCADCGICRVGRGIGKDFIHCKTCGVCVSIANENSHKCIERASDCDCPICGEYLFSSLQAVVFMRCGHSIHRKCHDELMKTSYKCPICSQSMINMESQFRNLDRAIDSQPMPPQFQDTKAVVSCNDCYAKSLVKYHWLGLRCGICDSYNTVQLRIFSDLDTEVPTEMIDNESPHAEPSPGNINSPDNRPRFPSNAGSGRSRRHSSHMRSIPSEAELDSLQISSFNIPQRLGRSVSPFRNPVFSNDPTLVDRPNGQSMESGDEDEEMDFWGGDAPRSPIRGEEAIEDEEDSDDDSTMSMEDGDDDGDDEDRMELFGHR